MPHTELINRKRLLYLAILDTNPNRLTDLEVELGALLAKDRDIQNILEHFAAEKKE
jgi:hypothetical protein